MIALSPIFTLAEVWDNMEELLWGFAAIGVAAYAWRMISGWTQYRNSVQKMLYTGYLEFWTKRKKLRKLSESMELQEDFGKHRIHYQLYSEKKGKTPEAYVLVTMSSGVYFVKVMNSQGDISNAQKGMWTSTYSVDKKHPEHKTVDKLGNPPAELKSFADKMREKLGKYTYEEHDIMIFPDSSKLHIEEREIDGVRIIKRSALLDAMKEIHEKSAKDLTDVEIDAIWMTMAKESLELEEK